MRFDLRRFSPDGDGGGGGDQAAKDAAAKAAADKAAADAAAGGADKIAADKKAADDKAAADKAAADAAAKGGDGKGGKDDAGKDGDVVPETYDLKLPEQTKLGQSDVDDIAAFAKENKLTQKQAANLLKSRDEAAVATETRNTEIITGQVKEWDDDVRALTTLGKTYEETVSVSQKGFNAFIPENSEIRTFLKTSGLGSHPDAVALFYKLGLEVKEDKHQQGGGGGKPEKTAAQRMYPDLPSAAAKK